MSDERSRVERMLFISCVGRSGSTWLGKVLDANPHVLYKYELDKPALYPWFRGVPIRIDAAANGEEDRGLFASALERSVWTHSTRFMQTPRFRRPLSERRPGGPWRSAFSSRPVRRAASPVAPSPASP